MNFEESPLSRHILDQKSWAWLDLIGQPKPNPNDSSLLGFTAAGAGAVTRPVQSKERDIISVFDFMTAAQIADVQAGTALVDVTAAIQAAINAVSLIGGILFFPSGVYLIASTLIFKNNVIYRGSGRNSLGTLGTVLKYTGASDATQVNNPINSSTAANYAVEDMFIWSTVRTAGKACFADVGSTFVTLKRVTFFGNDYNVILDQSELVLVEECDCEVQASGTAGIWLVNGAEHSGGASANFTNRVTICNCQLNAAKGTGVGIADDGGVSHTLQDNNYNGLAKHIRVNGAHGLKISGGELETVGTTSIDFNTTKLGGNAGGASSTVSIEDLTLDSSDAINLITLAASSVNNLTTKNLRFNNNNAGGAPFSGLAAGVTINYQGVNNTQVGSGSANAGNSVVPKTAYTPAFTSSNADASIGNGTITGNYERNGSICTCTINMTFGTTTTKGTGNFQFSTPFSINNSNIDVGTWYGSPAGTVRGGPVVTAGGAIVNIAESAVGLLGGGSYVWANTNVINITFTFPVAPTN